MMRMKNGIGLAALVVALAACGGDRPATTVDNESFEDALAGIRAENLRAHVEYLADDRLEGRMTGEPGYDMAAEYVAGVFGELGLEPGGDDGGWYQPVVFQSYKVEPSASALITHRDGVETEFTYREDFGVRADRVREETEVRAEVVFAGFGVHAPEFGYSDFDGINVEGKILAVFSGAPDVIEGTNSAYFRSARTKRREAVKRGAVGFITLSTRQRSERWPWEKVQQWMDHAGLTWLSPEGDAGGYDAGIRGSAYVNDDVAKELFAGTPITFEAARDAAEAGEPRSTPLGFDVTIRTRSLFDETVSPNVIGIVRGTDPELADEYVVYTAHLDHVGRGPEVDGDDLYNGAYDNAMGVALMLEAARALAANPPRRSVMFIALTGEERGLLGSDYFVNYPTVPADSIVANINLDMPLFLYPVADLIAFGAEHSSLKSVVEGAVAVDGFALTPDPVPEENLFARSDQFSFVRGGIPAIYLIPGFTSLDSDIDGRALFDDHLDNHYHKPSDDLGRPVHWASAERFARANARIGFRVANDEARPTWNAGDFYGEKYGRGESVGSAAAR